MMEANINKIRAKIKPWTGRKGENRYYVNDWKQLAGVKVTYYKTGNVESATFNGETISNNSYNKDLAHVKVWFDDGANLHIDNLGDIDYQKHIMDSVIEAYSGECDDEPLMYTGALSKRELSAVLGALYKVENYDLAAKLTERFGWVNEDDDEGEHLDIEDCC